MISKNLFLAASIVLVLSACASKPASTVRKVAGTGDIDSSTTEKFESYSLPITRQGLTTTRVAYNFWSGEWPTPVIDVNSDKTGSTTIQAYKTLRDPKESDKVACTITNGIYHPWSKKDPSIIIYYSLSSRESYVAKEDTFLPMYDSEGNEKRLQIPKDSVISNVIYYAENYCGAILRMGKKARSISASCDFFTENKSLVMTSKKEKDDYSEQWLYLQCAEKNMDGSSLKAFVRDEEILKQPGIKQGCPAEYGQVQGAQSCGNAQP
jgi:hypothetical protein